MDNFAYQPEAENDKVFAISRFPSVNRETQNNYLVEVNSRSKHLKKPKFYQRLSLILTVLLILLIITLVAIVVSYCRSYDRSKICTTDECLRSATNLKYSLNLDVDPCDDFYEYTCGKWSEEHPNHGWFPAFSTFSTITERILISVVNFLTSEPGENEPLPVKQSRDFYKSCMDVDAIDKLGLSMVYKYLGEAGLPVIPSLFTKSDAEIASFKFDWLKADAVIKKVFAMDVLIGFTVDANNYNNSENVMFIGVPGNNCPLPSPLKSDKKFVSKKSEGEKDFLTLKREANERIFNYVLTTIIKNVTGNDPVTSLLKEATDVLLNMTLFVDELVTNYTVQDNYSFRPYVIKKLEASTNGFLRDQINKDYPEVWQKYIGHIFDGINVTVDVDRDLLYVEDTEFDYLPKILTYVLSTSDVYLELYMWWVTVFAMIINSSSDVVDYILKQTAPFYAGTSVLRSRSLDCASLVNSFMAMAVSYGVADRTFFNSTKPKVEQMLYDIKLAFVEHVNGITWMDRNTKEATLDKAKEMVSFIGYPEWLFEKGALELYYKGIEVKPDSYLENMMVVVKQYMPNKFEDLRNVNERTWRTDPTTVNAFNSFPDNAINIPMAILSFPIYNLGLEMLNYGAIGTVLGHELTHGFDNTGRKHDKFGNYKQWWTNETVETFEDKIQCFIKQYDNFTITGIDKHVQGLKTLGENLADNGGVNHAFKAYQHYLKKYGPEKKLPGFESFSSNQLFFIAFGSIWCETSSLEDLELQIDYDEHCPNSVRVVGTLQNSPEFAKAFNCPLGSNMNPKKKCKVW